MKTMLGVLLAFLLALPGVAQAQDRGASEKFNERARQAYDKGAFPEALELFVKAYQTFPDTRYLFNAGKACTRLKDFPSALYYYGRFLALSPDDRAAAKLRQEVSSLERGLKRRGLLPLAVSSTPEGALVTLDGQVHPHLKLTPLRFWVKPGQHSLRVELDGYQAVDQRLEVKKGQALEFKLEKRQRKASVKVQCHTQGQPCTVAVDGARPVEVPAGGQTLKLEGGRHVLDFSARGHVSQQKELMLKGGEPELLEVTLKVAAARDEDPKVVAVVKPKKPAATDVVQKVPLKPVQKQPAPAEGAAGSGPSAYRIWSYAAMGVGAAAVVTGVALYSVGSLRMNNAQDDYRAGDLRYSTYQERFSSGRDLANAGLWTTGAGLVVGATGVVLYHFFPATDTVLGFSPSNDGAVIGIMRSW